MWYSRRAAWLLLTLLTVSTAAPASAQSSSHVHLTRDALVFAIRGTAQTPAQMVRLEHATTGPSVRWTASATVPWLVITPSGQSPSRVTIALGDVSALADGEFTGQVRILHGASTQEVVIRVTLQKSATRGGPPTGHMDVPADRYAVPGPVVFHGWAIDDVHVTSVDLVAVGDPRVLATARFSEGGRPDIEQLRPVVPMQTRSAWSAVIDPATMGMAPGSLMVAAIAKDAEGQSSELGRRLISFTPVEGAGGAPRRLAITTVAAATAIAWFVVMMWSVRGARRVPLAPRPVTEVIAMWEVVAIGVVVGAFVALRPGWMNRPLTYDELYTAARFVVDVPMLRAATGVEVFNNHPLYSVVTWVFTSVLGSTEFVLRLPALLFGTIAILATWRLARRWLPALPAVAAAGLLAALPLFGEWSRSARGYSAAAALTCLSVLWLIRTRESGRTRDALVHAVLTALAVYAHLYAVWVLAVQVLAVGALVIRNRPRPVDRGTTAVVASCATSCLLAVAAYLPMAANLLAVAQGRGRGEGAGSFGWDLARSLTGMETMAAVVGVIVIALIGALTLWQRSRLGAVLLVGTLAAPLAVMWGVVRPFDLYPQFFVFWTPLFVVLLAAGLWVLWRPRMTRVVAVAVLVWLGGVWGPPAITRPPEGGGYRDMVDTASIGDAPVFALGADGEMLSYYAGPMMALQSVADIDVALTTAPMAIVLYHNVRRNTPDTRALAARLSKQCDTTTRGIIVTYVCR